MSDVYGPLVLLDDVERAVIGTLRTPPGVGNSYPRIVYYLAELERQNGLKPRTINPPPGPSSYRGGMDHGTFVQDEFPLLIVVAIPEGPPERVSVGEYTQWFRVEVSATVQDQTEDEARELANLYGTAVTGAVLQDRDGPLAHAAQETRLEEFPHLMWPNPDVRNIIQSHATFKVAVNQVVIENGPTSWPANPYGQPGDWPTVESVNVTVTAEPLS